MLGLHLSRCPISIVDISWWQCPVAHNWQRPSFLWRNCDVSPGNEYLVTYASHWLRRLWEILQHVTHNFLLSSFSWNFGHSFQVPLSSVTISTDILILKISLIGRPTNIRSFISVSLILEYFFLKYRTPHRCLHLIVVVGFECYAGGSFATGRVTHAGQVKG
jgi:hypothetical protein